MKIINAENNEVVGTIELTDGRWLVDTEVKELRDIEVVRKVESTGEDDGEEFIALQAEPIDSSDPEFPEWYGDAIVSLGYYLDEAD